jgi:predicted phosphodiesterase
LRYGILADVHSNLEALQAVLAAYRQEDIDSYCCVGDIVGYAANPRECVEELRRICSVTVAGNHDWASVDLFSLGYFNTLAKTALLWTNHNLDDDSRYFLRALKPVYKNQEFTLVHGTLDEPQDFKYMLDEPAARATFRLLETDICFAGHTHAAGIFVQADNGIISYSVEGQLDIKKGNKYIVNVGSVGQPRDTDSRAAYCVYDTARGTIEIKRATYDVESARKKIIEAGLPAFQGNRLLEGR